MISGSGDDSRVLQKILSLKGYALQAMIADGIKQIPTEFKPFSTVVLNNVSKEQLPPKFLPRIQRFVEKGGGLLLIGGDRSFGLGGYIDTELEEISPVKFVSPKTKKRRLNSAVILVIDKSRSMATNQKMESAKRAALTAVNSLKDDDYVGVIGFDATPFVVIRLDKVAKVKPIAPRRLLNLVAAGKTNLLPALAAAEQSLSTAKASRKHIIVLSDGKVPSVGNAYLNQINKLRNKGVTVSTIALGYQADATFLELLAKYGNGAFYHTLDPSSLPEIFLRDIKVSTGEKTLKEKSEFFIKVGPLGTRSTTINQFPTLKGFVETEIKRLAYLELFTEERAKEFPILASWKYGDGTVIAYTSDANGRWSLPWLRWPRFARFWGQVIETLKKTTTEKETDVDIDLRHSIVQQGVMLDLSVFDKKLVDGQTPQITAKVTEPGGELTQVIFLPTSPGRFAARIERARPGDYTMDILYNGVKFPPLAITASGEAFGEKRGAGIDVQNLSNIAFESGGIINPSPEQVSKVTRIRAEKHHLFLPLIILAFALIILEAIIREMGLAFWTMLKHFITAPPKVSVGFEVTGSYQPPKKKRKHSAV